MMHRAPRYYTLLSLLALWSAGCTASERSAAPDDRDSGEARDGDIVTSEEVGASSATSLEELLRGRVSGVRVVETRGGGVAVLIRGVRSLDGENAPLYVVDGVPISPGPEGELPGISVYDIESIQVLKDLAASARYGSRGMNGVILIATKRPPELTGED